jgi:hypothetical protein
VRTLFGLLAIISVLGQAIIAVGVQNLSFFVIYAGRMILGMACESMAIVQSIFICQYFKQNQLSFVIVKLILTNY